VLREREIHQSQRLLDASVQTGGAALVRDNAFNFDVEMKPARYVDLEAGFSRSVPLQLNSFSLALAWTCARWARHRAGS